VICLDILRAFAREPGSWEGGSCMEMIKVAGNDKRVDALIANTRPDLGQAKNGKFPEAQARRLAEQLALALQASLVIRQAEPRRGRSVFWLHGLDHDLRATRWNAAGGELVRMLGNSPEHLSSGAVSASRCRN